jgi:small subunit ribosomal protein MRP21
MGNEGGLASALKSLNDILARNRVKQQVRSSERHEKKGVKRRRLQSERWRKQFANEVRHFIRVFSLWLLNGVNCRCGRRYS